MSFFTPFLNPALDKDADGFHGAFDGRETEEQADTDGFSWHWGSRRELSDREQEKLGMWAATLKVMAGTQRLLPTIPSFFPRTTTPPRSFWRPPLHQDRDGRFPVPPSSPQHHFAFPGLMPRHDIIQEASTTCTNIIRLAHALERRTNAERRLSRKARPRAAIVEV
ncbi:hypothetical protein B0H14DRAFT_3455693 [Mycena olivaceomarginata]|nr:hypothetical protein B0H14DRAFT_3455693 [Mycena olivaceomarginata]